MKNDVLEYRKQVCLNILKSFSYEEDDLFMKARSGVYIDNAENRRLNRVGKQYGTNSNNQYKKSKQELQKEESERQYKKAKTLLAALERRGLNYHISRSITDFGVSTYVQNSNELKFRISDHSVTNINRIINEVPFGYNTSIKSLADYALKVHKEKEKRERQRLEMWEKEKQERQELDTYWESIKDNFKDVVFKRNNRTYQDFDKFSQSGDRKKIAVYQKEINNGAYEYEWAEPVTITYIGKWRHADNHGSPKPSYSWLRWYKKHHKTKTR